LFEKKYSVKPNNKEQQSFLEYFLRAIIFGFMIKIALQIWPTLPFKVKTEKNKREKYLSLYITVNIASKTHQIYSIR